MNLEATKKAKAPLNLSVRGQIDRLTNENRCAICGVKLKRNEYVKELETSQIYPAGAFTYVRMHLRCGPTYKKSFS